MNPNQLLARYDLEHRRDVRIPGYLTTQTVALTRASATSGQAYVFWQSPSAAPEALVRDELQFHRGRSRRLTWKLYAHDAPPELAAALLAQGFENESPGQINPVCALQLNALPLSPTPSGLPAAPLPPGVMLDRLSHPGDIDGLVRLYEQIWPGAGNALWLEAYRDALAEGDDGLHLFAAIDAEKTWLASAAMVHYPGQHFGHLFGGCTLAAHRMQGLHGALTQRRLQELQTRGGQALVVDAGPQSLPLLLKKGFKQLTEVAFFSYRFDR